MTREEAIRKMEFCKNAYQKLIDEEVDNGTFVGTGVNGVWKADTPLAKAYSDMVDACDMAIKALEQESREITLDDVKGYCKPRNLTIITNELLYELTHPKTHCNCTDAEIAKSFIEDVEAVKELLPRAESAEV